MRLAQQSYICCSSREICPEFREYERTTTTFLNAYVGPLMDRYLSRLECMPEALDHAIEWRSHSYEGGSAACRSDAVVRSRRRRRGRHRDRPPRPDSIKVLGFDMGGTSTDVSLSEGSARQTTEAYIDGIPVRVPMLDIQTVGAGGGSIARVDAGGLLRVGPESAGATRSRLLWLR